VTTPGVDFFRVDRSGSVKRLLAVAGILVTTGATAIGAHLVHRLEADTGHLVSLVGGLTVAFGLILGFGAMAMILFENVYLLITDDGVVCHENGKETKLAWSEIEDVRLEAKLGVLVFARRAGPAVRWFAGNSAASVHAKVEEARRKALHGLLHVESAR
jgi:hypothetical protein